jgi:hypothetical protein
MVKNIILAISILLNVAVLVFAAWAYVMFNNGLFSYAALNTGFDQYCENDGFVNESLRENETAYNHSKKWCEYIEKYAEETRNEENKIPSIEGQEEETVFTSPDETEEIIQEISEYCEEHNISDCLPVESYSVVDLDEKYSVVKIGDFNYLLTKKDDEWNVSIVSQEENICDTGSGSSDLVEYCSN